MGKKLSKISAILLAGVLMVAMLPLAMGDSAYGASVKTQTLVNSFETGDPDVDYVKITTDGSKVSFTYRTMLGTSAYRIALRPVGKSGINVVPEDFTAEADKPFTKVLDVSNVEDGTYYLLLGGAKINDWHYYGGAMGYQFIGMPIKVTSGRAHIVEYKNVLAGNKSKRAASAAKGVLSKYKDKNLADVSFVFNDPYSGGRTSVSNSTMRAFYKKVSDQICEGADGNYERARRIYEFIAGNVYYDDVAFAEGAGQYIDPYKNLYNLVNNKSSKNSQKSSGKYGKVATTCVGNAAMVAALARAQGIPTKIAYGHALTSPWNTWSTESNVTARDHWWAECYVNGKWIIVDPTRGTNAKYDSDKGTWTKRVDGVLTYNYFDPSIEFISNTHYYFGYR